MLLTFFEKKQETTDVFSFIFKPDESIKWQAGQYLFYTFPNDNPDNRGVTRYFTISSAPFEKDIMITTRISLFSSTFKKSLVNMDIGDTIEASGPDGGFVIEDPPAEQDKAARAEALRAGPKKNYVFIAGGIGITPFRSILLDLDHKKLPINVQLLYANHEENIVFKEELSSLMSKNPRLPKPGTGGQANFKTNYFISPSRIDEKVIQDQRQKTKDQRPIFYISGPEPFVETYSQILKNIGVKKERIKLDHFPGYQNF